VAAPPDDRLAAIEAQVLKLSAEVANLATAMDSSPPPMPREQERLAVDAAPAPKPRVRPKPKPRKRAATGKQGA